MAYFFLFLSAANRICKDIYLEIEIKKIYFRSFCFIFVIADKRFNTNLNSKQRLKRQYFEISVSKVSLVEIIFFAFLYLSFYVMISEK